MIEPDNKQNSKSTAARKSSRIGFAVALMLGLASVQLAGCGFQLRGYGEQPIALQSVALKFGPDISRSSWSYAIKRQLSQGGITLTDEAPTQLMLTDIKTNKDIVSYDSRGKAAEYELSQSVTISITSEPAAPGAPVPPPLVDTLSRARIFTFDPENVSGKNQEERLLEREIRAELIRDIVLRLGDYSQYQTAQTDQPRQTNPRKQAPAGTAP